MSHRRFPTFHTLACCAALPWQFIKGTYPWSLLFLIPVGLAIATIVWEFASPLLRRRRRKKTVAKTD